MSGTEAMREALEWYAEQVAGCRKLGRIGDPARHALDNDGGERARNALALLATDRAAGVGENEGGQDRKFAFINGQFVNRVSGEPIPHDEPIIIFRARDHHAEHVLREYLSMATDEHHRQAIRERMQEFAAYREAHPERMKEPGITHHIRLNDEPATSPPAPADASGEVDDAMLLRMANAERAIERPDLPPMTKLLALRPQYERYRAMARAVLAQEPRP